MWHPLRQGSCESIIMYSELIKKRIDALATGENANTNDLGPDYWALIWEVATAYGRWPEGSRYLLFQI